MKLFNWFILACIVVIPISAILPISPKEAVWFSQYVALLFMSLIGCAVIAWKFNKWLALFLAYCTISTFFISGISPRAIMCTIQVALSIGAIYAISKFNMQQRKRVIYGIGILMLIECIMLSLQAWNLDPFFQSTLVKGKDEMVAFAGAKDQLGTLFALTGVPLLMISPFLAVISLIGLYISHSSFAVVAYIVSILFYLCFINKKAFFTVLCISIIAGTIYVKCVDKINTDDFKTRWGVWKYAMSSVNKGQIEYYPNLKVIPTKVGEYLSVDGQPMIIKANPFLGFGMGNFLNIFPKTKGENFNYYDEKFLHAHNDFVEVYFDLGIIGIVLLFSYLISLIYRIRKVVMTNELVSYLACFIAYLLNASGNFLTHLAVSGMFLILFIGLAEGVIRENGLSSRMG